MLSGIEPMVVGPDIRSDLTVRLDDPATLGSDLLVAAVGALDIYQPPLILVDMGTATTVTVVDADGAFRGGAHHPPASSSPCPRWHPTRRCCPASRWTPPPAPSAPTRWTA